MADWLSGLPRVPMQDAGPFTGGPPKGVLHTTETAGWPDYDAGTIAPHFSLMPDTSARTLVIRQHVPVNLAAKALVHDGPVQTNRDSAIQLELVGSCDPTSSHFPWHGAATPAWALTGLATFLRTLESACGISNRTVPLWLAYPQSYGPTRARLSLSAWDNFNGWCGHEHVPENVHGDPGDLQVAQLVAQIQAPTPVPVPHPTSAPRFPLPPEQYYGIPGRSAHTGYASASDRNGIRTWQAQMRHRGWKVDVDGLFGPITQTITRQFQTDKKLRLDGLVGPTTWSTAWTAPVT